MSQSGHLPMFESTGSTSKIIVDDYSTSNLDELVRNNFNSKASQRHASETCQEYAFCSCIKISHRDPAESGVSIVLSSENKLYVLHISAAELQSRRDAGSSSLPLVGRHQAYRCWNGTTCFQSSNRRG